MFGIVFCFAGLHALLYVQKKDMVPVWAIPLNYGTPQKCLLFCRVMQALTLRQSDGFFLVVKKSPPAPKLSARPSVLPRSWLLRMFGQE